MRLIELYLANMNFLNIVHRVGCCEESDGQYGQEYHDEICYLHIYGIGAHDETAVG